MEQFKKLEINKIQRINVVIFKLHLHLCYPNMSVL